MKLSALAELFGTATRPTHRALADARATVEVLHHLLERIGNLGVQSLEELLTLVRDASSAPADGAPAPQPPPRRAVPSAPGVYLFRGARDEVLYVGTSGDLRRRVRSYFTAGERRRRIRDMVAQAERVDTIVCAHALEAGVHELRLIAAHRPRYNRRSRNPNASWWVTATAEAFPRLSVVPTPRDGALGPFRSQHDAREAVDAVLDGRPPAAVHAAHPGPRRRAPGRARCYELRRCAAPCAGHQDVDGYAPAVAAWRRPRRRRGRRPAAHPRRRGRRAGGARAVRGGRPAPRPARRAGRGARPGPAAHRARRARGGGRRPAGRRAGAGSWPWCATAGSPRPGSRAAGVPPMPVVEALRAGATTVLPGPGPLHGAARRGGTAPAPLAHRRRHPPGALRRGRGKSPRAGPGAGRSGRAGPGRWRLPWSETMPSCGSTPHGAGRRSTRVAACRVPDPEESS